MKVIGGLRATRWQSKREACINGRRLPNSATVTRDSWCLLTHVAWGKRRVGPDEVWLFGLNNRRSWDSRYFGPVPLQSIRGCRAGADVGTVMARAQTAKGRVLGFII